MPALLRFRCPGCRARIKAPPQLHNHLRPCPKCGQTFLVQPEAPADAGPLLVPDEWYWPSAQRWYGTLLTS